MQIRDRTPDANDAVAKKYLSAAESIDTLAVWNMPWEAMARQVTCPQARTVDPIVLNAFELFPPWTARLKGLRVLVVSPFARTIRAQYGKRRQIWPGSEVLPDFELVTLEAAQTLGFETAGYPDWFAALNAMEEEMLSLTPFDVAIIGAGAYGLPLAAAAKNAGAVALHVGGVHQLYFGIRGKRWEKGVMSEDTVHYAQYFNDSWVRPEEARPSGMNGADDGFYW